MGNLGPSIFLILSEKERKYYKQTEAVKTLFNFKGDQVL